eukprot:TRINITY_DN6085_c0_g1_i3.p1 TRINITY_DN6085_c0_g1~~TRINITY_DN6085_c0_g1_i3.p1  ORF type:complete len:452 (-),score=97.47 TRINITY_DN6085_c0_g1_i3:98-1423(-)
MEEGTGAYEEAPSPLPATSYSYYKPNHRESISDDKQLELVTQGLEHNWRSSSFSNVVLKKEKVTLDVFITDPILVDFSVFNLWIEGHTAKEASLRRKALSSGTPFDGQLFPELIGRDTIDQFRNFDLLEPILENPESFHNESLIQIELHVFRKMVNEYYSLNEDFLRELAGKKLRPRLKSNLDDISEKLKMPLRRCIRQFDNLKRIYSIVMDKKREAKLTTPVTEYLNQKYWISKDLSMKYCKYIFLSYHQIQTTDKRLNKFLTAGDLEFFAGVLMDQWTTDCYYLDLNKVFTEDIRDCKSYLLGDKVNIEKYRSLVIQKMAADSEVEEKKLGNLSHKFSDIMKTILKMGAGISKSKEFEDILDDLVKKVAEACYRQNFNSREVTCFFKSLIACFNPMMTSLQYTRHSDRLANNWFKFIEGIRQCVLVVKEYPRSVKIFIM